MTSHRGQNCSLLFLPATPSSPPWTLEGVFELTRRTLQGPSTRLVRCFWNDRERQLAHALAWEDLTHCQKTTDVNLEYVFVKNTLCFYNHP